MKKLLLVLPLFFILTACPVGLDYAPGTINSEKINSALIGTWTLNGEEGEVVKFEVKMVSSTKYSLDVLERGTTYTLETDHFDLYETTINGLHILYLKPDNEDKYYLYQYNFNGSKLEVSDIPLLNGGIEAVTSSETLRKEIKNSMTMNNFRQYVLTYSK